MLENCTVSIDDMLVCSDSGDDHLIHLSALFGRLEKASLKKSEFGKSKVTYLGHMVGQGHVSPREVQAIN